MSGIFAYLGKASCRDAVLEGLCHLEKRGNETAGIAIRNGDKIELTKIKGSPDELLKKAQSINEEALEGLAECSFSSRCRASAITAVPAANNLYAAALDGEIDNFDALKRWVKSPFPIATEEDLLLAMITVSNETNRLETIKKLSGSFQGNPSFAFLSAEEGTVFCRAGIQPLVIGTGEGGTFIASELGALLPFAKRFIRLERGESAKLTAERVSIFDDKFRKIKKQFTPLLPVPVFESGYQLDDELFYCPLAVRETLNAFVKRNELIIGNGNLKRLADKTKRIIITGEGSSYNAAALAVHYFGMMTDIPCTACPAGELRYGNEFFDKSTLIIAVSHSGENENSAECIRRAKGFGSKALCITASPCSLISSISDESVSPSCFQSSENSLRSYLSSSLALLFLAVYFGKRDGIVSELYLNVTLKIAEMLPGKISLAVKTTPLLEATAKRLLEYNKVFVTGLCGDCALSLEGASKFRQLTDVCAVSVPLHELALESDKLLGGSLVFALITDYDLAPRALSRLRRIRTLGGEVIIITTANIEDEIRDFENVISFSDSVAIFNKITCIAQLYKIAVTANGLTEKNEETA